MYCNYMPQGICLLLQPFPQGIQTERPWVWLPAYQNKIELPCVPVPPHSASSICTSTRACISECTSWVMKKHHKWATYGSMLSYVTGVSTAWRLSRITSELLLIHTTSYTSRPTSIRYLWIHSVWGLSHVKAISHWIPYMCHLTVYFKHISLLTRTSSAETRDGIHTLHSRSCDSALLRRL